MATEEAERRQRLLDERQSDPQRMADQRVKAADSELCAAVAERHRLVQQRVEQPPPIAM